MPREPLILSFDTSAAHCAAALLRGDEVLSSRHVEMKKGQAEHLFPLLEEMLGEAGIGWKDLARIATGIGPGNFTGIRISVAAARGLAMSLGIPVFGVSGFEALVHGLSRPLIASIDARGGRYYLQHFGEAGPDEPIVATTDSLPSEWFSTGYQVVGHDAPVLAGLTGATAIEPAAPIAVAIARIAAERPAENAPLPAPLYLRPAAATPSAMVLPPVLP